MCVCMYTYVLLVSNQAQSSHTLMFWFSSAQCYSLPLDTHCITDTSTLNSSSEFWLQFTTNITKHQSYLWILLHFSVKFPLQCLRSDNPNQPSWFDGNWEGGYTEKNLANLNFKYSNNSFWPQNTVWIFILLMEKGLLLVLAWYFAAVQLSMPSSAFPAVFLTEEREWESESCDFRSVQDHAPVGTASPAHMEL